MIFRRKPKKEDIKQDEEEIDFKELEKDRAYSFRVGKVRFLSVKLPSSDLSEIAAGVKTNGIEGSRKKQETKEWLTIVRGEDYKTRPYDIWAKLSAKGLTTSTSTTVTSSSIAVSTTQPPPVSIKKCPMCRNVSDFYDKKCNNCGYEYS